MAGLAERWQANCDGQIRGGQPAEPKLPRIAEMSAPWGNAKARRQSLREFPTASRTFTAANKNSKPH